MEECSRPRGARNLTGQVSRDGGTDGNAVPLLNGGARAPDSDEDAHAFLIRLFAALLCGLSLLGVSPLARTTAVTVGFTRSQSLQPTRPTSPTRAQGAWLGTRPSTSLGEVDHPQARRAEDGRVGATPWDGEVLAAELDDQRGPRAFVHEPGGFEPVLQQQGGETFLCVNDHLGMPKDLVSGDGLVVWTAAHSAYGRVIAVDADLAAKARYGESASVTAGARGTATGIESPFRLLGQVADEDAEIGWTRFRCFDAETRNTATAVRRVGV